jgi:hypothetical protein
VAAIDQSGAHFRPPVCVRVWNRRDWGGVHVCSSLSNNDKRFGCMAQVLTNATFNASIVAATKHYPCNTTTASAVEAHLKFWAGEDTPTWYGNWTAASCWGRKLSQHWVNINATSTVAWAVLWSA